MVRNTRDLLGMLQLGLEAHHVEQRAERVVLAQLHDRVGFDPRPMRIGEARPASSAPSAAFRGPRAAITSIGRQPSK